jgi:ABC-type bacteriocin/lantibiotic exporter with double-glycine peptidase domain
MMPQLLPVPHRPQRAEADCLVACASMVLEYLNVAHTYQTIGQLLGLTPYGTPISRVRNLQQLGLTVVYEPGTLETLNDQLTAGRPCVVPVRTGELSYWREDVRHAVVVVGLTPLTIFLNDPAFDKAPIGVARAEFELAWIEQDNMYVMLNITE